MRKWWKPNVKGSDSYGNTTYGERFYDVRPFMGGVVMEAGAIPVDTSVTNEEPEDGGAASTRSNRSHSAAWHYPVLDIDFPCELRPSKTEGHHHLLINRPMAWRHYKKILKSLAKAGVVDKDWVRLSLRRGFSMVIAEYPEANKTWWKGTSV